MEVLTKTISFILLSGLISVPILLFVGLKKWNRLRLSFLTYLTIGLIITAGITWTFAWWADYSEELLMTHYGYDFSVTNEADRFQKVRNENIEQVKQLEIGYFGIGWPLQAIMTFIFYLPYLLIVYIAGQFVTRIEKNN